MSEGDAAEDADVIRCWCGATGTYDELFDDSGLDDSCAGTGCLQCICGGDICVCHHHGETECPGCGECDFGDDGLDECDFDPEDEY